ncbi:dimethyl sulfoxide reductase anchor subunit family protein [Desulfitobacterium sp. AusDCA]|uniref:dimethyl sulfoxide reductase anchor subunit family protein n=1 Tax=Desulfitobacterium sp. AusDCA TaxID=3240383 RepID=UPI003DA6D24F
MVSSDFLPLIIFTLLVQWSVGVFSVITCFQLIYLRKAEDRNTMFEFERTKQFLTIPIMALALIVSLFHLGDPIGAYRSIYNLFSSWLSREVFFAVLLFGLLVAQVLLNRRIGRSHNHISIQIYNLFISFVGVCEIFIMSSIYFSTVNPMWSHFYTYVLFFGTTVIFGSVGILLASQRVKDKNNNLFRNRNKVIMILITAILIQLCLLPIYLNLLKGVSESGLIPYQLVKNKLFLQYLPRWCSALIISAIMYIYGHRQRLSPALLYVCTTILIISEILGRILFFETGIPTI